VLIRKGKCLKCGMCCGDEINGYCEYLIIFDQIGKPNSTLCSIYNSNNDKLVNFRSGCMEYPSRPIEIYPWYKCGYWFEEE